MEAPEKIYIDVNESWHRTYTAFAEKAKGNDIEYTRTDAFIEKALKWYCLDCACNDNCAANHKCAFRDFFEMYLEGNDKALPPKIGNAFNPDGSTTENYRYRHIIERMQDDFIEKACEWLDENWTSFVNYDNEDGVVYYLNLTDKFKNYMKGE